MQNVLFLTIVIHIFLLAQATGCPSTLIFYHLKGIVHAAIKEGGHEWYQSELGKFRPVKAKNAITKSGIGQRSDRLMFWSQFFSFFLLPPPLPLCVGK
jgi:hypothetical protein